jgi:hypothetical protein
MNLIVSFITRSALTSLCDLQAELWNWRWCAERAISRLELYKDQAQLFSWWVVWFRGDKTKLTVIPSVKSRGGGVSCAGGRQPHLADEAPGRPGRCSPLARCVPGSATTSQRHRVNTSLSLSSCCCCCESLLARSGRCWFNWEAAAALFGRITPRRWLNTILCLCSVSVRPFIKYTVHTAECVVLRLMNNHCKQCAEWQSACQVRHPVRPSVLSRLYHSHAACMHVRK